MSRTRSLLCGLTALAIASSASAQVDLDFRLVAVTIPTGSDTVTTLPGSIPAVCAGATYYIELWVSDVGTVNTGVSSAYVDLVWPGALATAASVDHGTTYDVLPSGTIQYGRVDELGGTVLSSTGVAMEPVWVRAAVVELTAGATGSTRYRLQPSATGVAALGRGVIPWADVSLGEVTITTQWCRDALLSCTPQAQASAINRSVTVDIFVEGVADLNAYQIEVAPVLVSGAGSLTLNDCYVDSGRSDFALAGLNPFTSCDPNSLQIAAVATQSRTAAVPGGWPAYVGTYVFDVSADATNESRFELRLLPQPSSLLLDPLSQTLPFDIAGPCAVEILECQTATVFAEGSRFLQATLNPAGSPCPQAIQITSPDCPGLRLFAGANGCLGTGPPTFKPPAEWGTVHMTGEDIVPGFTYEVTVLCRDTEIEGGTSLASTWPWGDATDDGIVNVIDIQKVVQCAEGTFHGNTTIYNTNLISDCDPGECDVFDVLAVLDAFRDQPYPGPTPCLPPDQTQIDDGLPDAHDTTGAVVTLVPLAAAPAPGDPLTVEAYVQNVSNLRAYQLQPFISGGTQGGLLCSDLLVDTGRPDYVFYNAASDDWPWVNAGLCRLSSSLTDGGVNVGEEAKYLGTFVLASSDGGCGVFTAAVDAASSVLLDPGALSIKFMANDVKLVVSPPRDYDCDGDVDLNDHIEIGSCFSGPEKRTGLPSGCSVFDFDGDGDIDLVDWSAFQAGFTGGALP